jgi:hypothetical protein
MARNVIVFYIIIIIMYIQNAVINLNFSLQSSGKLISCLLQSSQLLPFVLIILVSVNPCLFQFQISSNFISHTMSNSTTHHIISPTQTGEDEAPVYYPTASFPQNQPKQKKASSSHHYKEKHFSQLSLFGRKPSSALIQRITPVRASTFAKKNGTIITRKAHLRTIPSVGCKAVRSAPLVPVFKASNLPLSSFTMEDYREYFGPYSKGHLITQGILQTSDDIAAYECARRSYMEDLLENK